MDIQEESSNFGTLREAMTSRNMSSSSSTFFSANQSPFFSPKSPSLQPPSKSTTGPHVTSVAEPKSVGNVRYAFSDISSSTACCNNSSDLPEHDRVSSSIGISSSTVSGHNNYAYEDGYFGQEEKRVKGGGRNHKTSSTVGCSISHSSYRLRNCDVFIGLHGRKPPLLRFVNWLRAELEVQGISCFVSDRARCKNSRKHSNVERAMDAASFGIVIITRKCFKNPYTIEELQFFSGKKNLVPIYFDLSPADCLVRDIIEKRGDPWEKHGGELWVSYGGLEQEWKDAVHGLSRVDEWKLEASDGNWRDCILSAVISLAMRLGRRSVAEHLTKWREKVEKEEFPFTRNENFIGRKKEISQLEFILFGDVTGDSERDYIELKARSKRKNFTFGWRKSNNALDERYRERHMKKNISRKAKEPVVWKESEKDIEMQSSEFSMKHYSSRLKRGRRKRGGKILYGKGIACVSGDSGIGKTELVLEFAYRYHQRYKMILWIGGESRYIRQNYLNLRSIVEVDVGVENSLEKSRIKSFEEQEEAAISKVRKQLMRNIPYLVVIDNLESEKDWWDHRLVMDLLPRFGGETHVIITSRLHHIMNLEPLKLSCLSGVEAMSLMLGSSKDYPVAEMDALRTIEEKVGRLPLALAIVSAILSELPIAPSRLFETINRMPLKDISWSGKDASSLRNNTFLVQLFEVCFSIFDHADGPRSLATRMVLASGWFAPSAIPVSLLALAAHKMPEKCQGTCFWRKFLQTMTCGLTSSHTKKSELEASSLLLRINIARSSTKQGWIQFNELIRVYARKRGMSTGAAQAVVQTVNSEGSIFPGPDHLWAACFLAFGFGHDPVIVELKVSELLYMVKKVVLPLAIHTFITFSRCSAALELLRLCTNLLEAADQAFVTPVDKWLDKSLCWRAIQTNAQLNRCLWQELALCRATVLETRAKLMLRGAQFDIGDDLIRKAVFIRTSICGEDHPDTKSARETLSKLSRLVANAQIHASS